jgi:DNA-binding IclR family transcriptional regulator
MTETGVRPVKSALHAIDVLEFLAARPDEPARMREIAQATDIPRSSLYALLRTLTERGWVRRDPSGTLYSVGLRVLMTGISYLDSDATLRTVKPWLERLNETLDETVHLARLDERDIVYLATKESTQYLRVINRVGRRLPASSTSLGKALLAAQPAGDLDRHLYAPLPRLTEFTVTDRSALEADLDGVRQRGYAVDLEENTLGLKCFGFALPIQYPPVDAISCSVPLARLSPEREQTIIQTMGAAVRDIARSAPGGLATY